MYKIGDLILYGSTGVCRVADIVTRDSSCQEKEQLFYILQPLYQDCIISTPVDTKKVFMRPVISKDEAIRLIDMIPSISAEAYYNNALSQLTEHYEASMKTHECSDLIQLTMSIYVKKKEAEQQRRKLGAVDERFMKRGEELLYGELAVALDIPKNEVPQFIAGRVDEANKISGEAVSG